MMSKTKTRRRLIPDFTIYHAGRGIDLQPRTIEAWDWLDDYVVDYEIKAGNIVPVDAGIIGQLVEHAPVHDLTFKVEH